MATAAAALYPPQLPDLTRPSPGPGRSRPTFPSYRDAANLPENTKLLCEIVATTAPLSTASALDAAGVSVTQTDVEQVLTLSYSFLAGSSVFFRWAGCQLRRSHSPYSWNLVVDLLGKNLLFAPMWDAIRSMKRLRLVSLATFASVFSSYVVAGRVKDALMSFEVMDRYACPCDVVALNSLVSAICRDGSCVDASECVRMVKYVIRPDADTYAILLEGWEKEMDVINARQTFSEMVVEIGWDRENTLAYEAYLCTLLLGPNGMSEVMKVLGMMVERECHPGVRFFRLALEECLKCRDVRFAEVLWENMARLDRAKVRPDIGIYCMMVALYCYVDCTEQAKKLFDQLISAGGFLDSNTCNLLFSSLVTSKKLNEASELFNDMVKRGWVPDQASCGEAVRMSVDSNNAYMACKVWQSMIATYKTNLEETGNLLLVGLCDFRMVDEAAKHTEEMIKKGIQLSSLTFSKLK